MALLSAILDLQLQKPVLRNSRIPQSWKGRKLSLKTLLLGIGIYLLCSAGFFFWVLLTQGRRGEANQFFTRLLPKPKAENSEQGTGNRE